MTNDALSQKFLQLVSSGWKSQALYVAAELGIAELLSDRPMTIEDLAIAVDAHPISLRQLLRALVTLEICKESENHTFAITPMGLLLVAGTSNSLNSWTKWCGTNLWRTWGSLLSSVKTGNSARKLLDGSEGFEHLEGDAEAANIFNNALVELTRLISKRVVAEYDFSNFQRITDIGGGYGELLATILETNPDTMGVLFDRPLTIEGARKHFSEAGLTSRCEFVEGDFFDKVNVIADAYVLKSVIHDWDDAHSRDILKNCRATMPDNALLLLVERVMPEQPGVSEEHQDLARSDLTMLVAHGSGERTAEEFKQLLTSADFHMTRLVPVGLTFSVIEAVPV